MQMELIELDGPVNLVRLDGRLDAPGADTVSYTHLTLPTNREV